MYTIIAKENLNSHQIVRGASPRQFIIVRIHEHGECIPLTVADYDRERGTITLVVQEVGKTTMEMGAMQVGGQTH